MEVRAEIGLETTIRVRDAWSTFALLDPVNGPPTEVDRGNVKRSEWEVIDFETAPYDRCGLLREWR
jgi:hypothetical protein